MRGFRPDDHHAFGRREPCRPLDRWAGAFIQTNVVGTLALLEAALEHWRSARTGARETFRFHHVSTDEVFGSLGREGPSTRPRPTSQTRLIRPSKAASDHLVRAWHHTYGLPIVLSNCSNNYGPYQFPGEAHAADDPQRARGPARCRSTGAAKTCATGLCRGPRPRTDPHRRDRPDRRKLQRRRWSETPQHRRGARGLRDARRDRARFENRASRAAAHLRRGPSGARPALCNRRRRRSAANSVGRPRALRDGSAQDRRMVPREPRMVDTHPLRPEPPRAPGSVA